MFTFDFGKRDVDCAARHLQPATSRAFQDTLAVMNSFTFASGADQRCRYRARPAPRRAGLQRKGALAIIQRLPYLRMH